MMEIRNKMKIVTVTLRNQKISPRKGQLVMSLIRGMKVEDALKQLQFSSKKSSALAFSLLKSGISSAKQKDFDIKDLVIGESVCQEGPKLKRFYIRARGRSTVFYKRGAHLKISLSSEEKTENLIKKESASVKSETKKSVKKNEENKTTQNKKVKEKNGTKS